MAGNIIQKAAPTGVAANGINGNTIHSLFRLPITKGGDMPELTTSAATNLRNKLRGVEYIIVDEKSMISTRTLNQLDRRLRQIFENADDFFGGKNVVLIGDFYQLPPVGGYSLFTEEKELKNPRDIAGRTAYMQFSKSIELTQIVRQSGEDQKAFREALDGLRNNNPTIAHWRTLSSRVQTVLSQEEVRSFDDAVRVYAKNAQVREYNITHLEKLDKPVVSVKAVNRGAGAEAVVPADAGNLHNTIPLCQGARVMLSENLWTPAGLVNGAMGYVYDLAWGPDVDDVRNTAPFVVLVEMDKYTGLRCFPEDSGIPANVVPIFLSTRDFTRGSAACSRTQLPITIAYAITVHRSQGCTLTKLVADISTRDFTAGLSYVAVSRATRLEGIMFDVPFSIDSMRIKKDETGKRRLKDVNRRREADEFLVPP